MLRRLGTPIQDDLNNAKNLQGDIYHARRTCASRTCCFNSCPLRPPPIGRLPIRCRSCLRCFGRSASHLPEPHPDHSPSPNSIKSYDVRCTPISFSTSSRTNCSPAISATGTAFGRSPLDTRPLPNPRRAYRPVGRRSWRETRAERDPHRCQRPRPVSSRTCTGNTDSASTTSATRVTSRGSNCCTSTAPMQCLRHASRSRLSPTNQKAAAPGRTGPRPHLTTETAVLQ